MYVCMLHYMHINKERGRSDCPGGFQMGPPKAGLQYVCVSTHTYMYTYIYIYIYREREKER